MKLTCSVCKSFMGFSSVAPKAVIICGGCLTADTDDATVQMVIGCFERKALLTEEQIDFIEYAIEKREAIEFENKCS
jgi:hypothetical protein